MARRYDVFISSTFLDNEERRKLVEDAVIRAGLHPVGMERFTASVKPAAEHCIRLARDADLLVGIIGWRYGWEPPGYDRSITELEYDSAPERLMFLVDESLPPSGDGDLDEEPDRARKQARLAAFKARIGKDQTPARFTEARLQLLVFEALCQWKEDKESATADQASVAEVRGGAPRIHYRSDIEWLARFYTGIFVGRDDLLSELVSWVTGAAPGYLLLTALPGYGKSAVAFELLRQLGSKSNVLCFFVRANEGANTADDYFRAVNAQLLDVTHRPGGVPSDLAGQRRQFAELWRMATDRASSEQPLVLIVDGLDEAAPALGTSIPSLLPNFLAPHVHVICTSRPAPDPRQFVPIEHPLRAATLRSLRPLETREIEALLIKLGFVGPSTTVAERILGLTKGVPLFVRFVAADVATLGESVIETIEQQAPSGVCDYFAQQAEQITRLSAPGLTRKLVGILLATQGPISADELASVLGHGVPEVSETLTTLRRFLAGADRFQFFHAEIRRALAAWIGATDVAAARSQLIAWCATTAENHWPKETGGYALRYYASHLFEEGDFERLAELPTPMWLRAQRTIAGSYRWALAGIDLALRATRARRPKIDLRENSWHVLGALARTIAGQVPKAAVAALARAGDTTQALALAETVADPYERTDAFLLLAEAEITKNAEYATDLVELAIATLRFIDPYIIVSEMMSKLGTMVGAIGSHRLLNLAVRAIAEHPRPDMRRISVLALAVGLASYPAFRGEAAGLAKQFVPLDLAGGEWELLADVAVRSMSHELVAAMQQRLRRVEAGFVGAGSLAPLARAEAGIGLVTEARATATRALRKARAADSPDSRVQALAACARVMSGISALSDFALRAARQAIRSARLLQRDEAGRCLALEAIALVENGQSLCQLRAEFADCEDADDRALRAAKEGNAAEALRIIGTLEPSRRGGVGYAVCHVFCERGLADEARLVVESMEQDEHAAPAWGDLALMLASCRRKEEAREAARISLDRAERLAFAHFTSMATRRWMWHAANQLAKGGQMDRARSIAEWAIRCYGSTAAALPALVPLSGAVATLIESDRPQDAIDLAVAFGISGRGIREWDEEAMATSLRAAPRTAPATVMVARSVLEREADTALLELRWDTTLAAAEVLIAIGERAGAAAAMRRVFDDMIRAWGERHEEPLTSEPEPLEPGVTYGESIGARSDSTLLAKIVRLATQADAVPLAEEATAKLVEMATVRWSTSRYVLCDRLNAISSLLARGRSSEARSLTVKLGLDDPDSAELLVEGGPFVDAMRALGESSRESLLRWQGASKRLRGFADRATALSEVAAAFAECSHVAEARSCADDALEAARSSEPSVTLNALAVCAVVIARTDGSDALWNAFQTFTTMYEQAW